MDKYKVTILYRDGHVEKRTHFWDDDHIARHFKEEFEKHEDVLMVEIYKEFKVFNRE